MKNTSICFSGHRPSKLPRGEELKNLKIKLYRAVDRAVDEGFNTFYFGACIGFDLFAAMAVIVRRKRKKPTDSGDIRLIAVVPFRNQPHKWSESDKRLYYELLSYCDDVVYLSENYHTGCYHERNRYMVDRSSRLICYYDGSGGGTSYTVDYAEKQGLGITNLY